MVEDPIVEEVRKVRHQIEKEFGNDVKKHIEHIYQEQQKHSARLVSRQPRMLKRKKVA
jgi:tartrate dehydratase alpha subunit/fumarate hydratase class I-like protein